MSMLKYLTDNNGILKPTMSQIDQYIRHCKMYEIRDDHVQAFNTAYLAVTKAYFLPKDANALFEIFGFDHTLISNALKQAVGIHDKTHVIRNDFNMGTLWVIYCLGLMKSLPVSKRNEIQFTLLKMLNYKFFTGKVNHMFKYKTDEGVMEATIDGLSLKCDIKNPKTPTWKAIIEAHCTEALSNSSIHRNTFQTFAPDGKVGYILSDMQTRLSSKIVNVASAYYENHKNQNKIGESTFTQMDPDGEKVLKELKASIDMAVSRICTDVLNINSFINFEDVKLICKLVPSVRPDMLRTTLTILTNVANIQYKNKQAEAITKGTRGQTIYEGYRTLLTELIQKTYRYCIMSGVNMESHVAILAKTRDIYRASRIANPDILTIKNSADHFVTTHTKYTRDATLVAVRTACILYIILQTFK